MEEKNTASRRVTAGIQLQILVGFGFLLPSLFEAELPPFMADPKMVGGMFILLALNSLLYFKKYEKAQRKRSEKENPETQT